MFSIEPLATPASETWSKQLLDRASSAYKKKAIVGSLEKDVVAAREAKVIGACLNNGVHAVQQNMATVSAPAPFMDFFATRVCPSDLRLPPLVPDGRVGLCPPVSSSLDGCGPG